MLEFEHIIWFRELLRSSLNLPVHYLFGMEGFVDAAGRY